MEVRENTYKNGKPLRRTRDLVAGAGTATRSSNVLTTRFFARSPQSLTLLVPPLVYPLLDGPPELWLPLMLAGLSSCLYLTMLEFTGVLIVVNVFYLGGHRGLPGTGLGFDAAAALLLFDVLLLYGRYAVFRRLHLLSAVNRHLGELAMVDNLTGAYNRHYLGEEGDRIYHGFVRGGEPFAVILMDIDDFKVINDIHGHAGGDAALTWLADLLNGVLRARDVAGRYGGDEFLIILPGTRLDEAWRTAKRLRSCIVYREEGAPAACRDLRVSMGLARVETTDSGFSDVVEHADTALYQAKREGRDAIRIWRSRVREPAVCRA